jgi:hypothetical protein
MLCAAELRSWRRKASDSVMICSAKSNSCNVRKVSRRTMLQVTVQWSSAWPACGGTRFMGKKAAGAVRRGAGIVAVPATAPRNEAGCLTLSSFMHTCNEPMSILVELAAAAVLSADLLVVPLHQGRFRRFPRRRPGRSTWTPATRPPKWPVPNRPARISLLSSTSVSRRGHRVRTVQRTGADVLLRRFSDPRGHQTTRTRNHCRKRIVGRQVHVIR